MLLMAMRRQPLFLLLGAFGAGLLASACGGAGERIVMHDQALKQGALSRIDLLPVDFYVHIDGEGGKADDQNRETANQEISTAIESWMRQFLAGRGYQLGNRITWDGVSGAYATVGGRPIRELALDILDFVNSSQLPVGTGNSPQFVQPEQLRVLASATGSEAVLYINGKASVQSDAQRAQKAFTAICCFIMAVATILLIFSQSKSSSHSTKASPPGRVGHRPPPPPRVHRAPAPRVYLSAPIFIHVGPSHSQRVYDVEPTDDEQLEGDRLWLSFTLVSTTNGQVLWHARRVVDIAATDDADLQETMVDLFHSFPRAHPAATSERQPVHQVAPPAGNKLVQPAVPPSNETPLAPTSPPVTP